MGDSATSTVATTMISSSSSSNFVEQGIDTEHDVNAEKALKTNHNENNAALLFDDDEEAAGALEESAEDKLEDVEVDATEVVEKIGGGDDINYEGDEENATVVTEEKVNDALIRSAFYQAKKVIIKPLLHSYYWLFLITM